LLRLLLVARAVLALLLQQIDAASSPFVALASGERVDGARVALCRNVLRRVGDRAAVPRACVTCECRTLLRRKLAQTAHGGRRLLRVALMRGRAVGIIHRRCTMVNRCRPGRV
jgi:hypothetical protein